MSQLTQTSVIQQLQPVVTVLQEALGDDLVALVLFGSRACGDATPDSDWDVLLLAHNLPERPFPRHRYLQKLLPPPWRTQISLLAKTLAEFETAVPPLFLDIALDGIILYDPDHYAANRLAYLHKLLQTKGLFRRQQGKEMIWLWQSFPGLNWQITWEETA
ncbi:MAG: nucleotidyltransferase domain-containing protein [Ardenticatenales bacterium]|nr:nucleotidyltransferase domain-containing protein [Ardenticatenales bacterium]